MRENALCAFLAGAATATMAWLGLYGFVWSDYDEEARPAFDALTHGHVAEFLRLAPAYGGSLVERAPFALMPSLWGGGELAVYRTVAIPCLLAGGRAGRVAGRANAHAGTHNRRAKAVTLGLCVANPVTLYALEIGHPEELLGACLCVAAVLLASRGKWLWAGVLLGLAIANKEWALLALGPVLLALPARRRAACLASAGAAAAAVLGPLVLVGSGGFVAGTKAFASASGEIFQPWQLWWFFGAPNHVLAPSGASHTAPIERCAEHPSSLAYSAYMDLRCPPSADLGGRIGARGSRVAAAQRRRSGRHPQTRRARGDAAVGPDDVVALPAGRLGRNVLPAAVPVCSACVGGKRPIAPPTRSCSVEYRSRLVELSVAARTRVARRPSGLLSRLDPAARGAVGTDPVQARRASRA